MYVHRGRVNAGGQGKGVDVSLALNLVRATHDRQCEVAVIVSQDWDFGPAVRLTKEIAQAQCRRLVFASSFPVGLEAFRGEGFRELPGFQKPRKPATPAAIRETTAQAGSERPGIEIVCHFDIPG